MQYFTYIKGKISILIINVKINDEKTEMYTSKIKT